jgi:pantoate--beta-alanine ligase
VKEAANHSEIVVVSIFVNPAQFAPHEDLSKYPRTLEQDLEKLKAQNIAQYVFSPSVEVLYPRGIPLEVSQQIGTFVSVQGLSHQMEGVTRPHFFRGVATVVTKLFNAVQPDVAVFGQKDAQQCVVIRNMVEDLLVPVKLVVAPTIRDEHDGLALSSRNRYLNEDDRKAAPAFAQGLLAAQRAFNNQGIVNRVELFQLIQDHLALKRAQGHPLELEYLSLVNRQLHEVDQIATESNQSGAILSGAVRIGSTRLIDNVLLGLQL